MTRPPGRHAEVDPARTEQLVQAVVAAPDDERAVDAIIFRVIAEDFVLAARQLRAAREQLGEYEHMRKRLVRRFDLHEAMRPSRVAEKVIFAYDELEAAGP